MRVKRYGRGLPRIRRKNWVNWVCDGALVIMLTALLTSSSMMTVWGMK